MKELAKIILILTNIPILISAIYALTFYKRMDCKFKIFSCFLFFSFLVQASSSALWFLGKNNLPLLHIYVAGGFILLAWFYREILADFIDKRIINAIMVIFTLFTLANTIFWQPINVFNSYALTIESALLLFFTLCWFISSMTLMSSDTPHDKTEVSSINWINAGIMIYYSSSLLIFYFGTMITSFSKNMNRYAWAIHSFFSITMYCFFLIALWKKQKN